MSEMSVLNLNLIMLSMKLRFTLDSLKLHTKAVTVYANFYSRRLNSCQVILAQIAQAAETPACVSTFLDEQYRLELLRVRIRALPPLPDSASNRSEGEWLANRQQLRQHILQSDPIRFLEWDVIGKTMFVGDAP